MDIRRLGPGDGKVAHEAARLLRGIDVPAEQLSELLADPRYFLIVAIADHVVAGGAVAYELSRLDGARMMLLYEIEVDAAHQGMGFGTALIDELKRICAVQDVAKMWLLTDSSNEAARALYESTGAEVWSKDKLLYGWGFGSTV